MTVPIEGFVDQLAQKSTLSRLHFPEASTPPKPAEGWSAMPHPSCRLIRTTAGAKAGHRHRLIGAGGGEVKALSDQRGFRNLAAPLKAVQQPAQRPQIVGMDLSARQRAPETEILPIDTLGLCRSPLLQEQRTECMADRLHPTPRLVVG